MDPLPLIPLYKPLLICVRKGQWTEAHKLIDFYKRSHHKSWSCCFNLLESVCKDKNKIVAELIIDFCSNLVIASEDLQDYPFLSSLLTYGVNRRSEQLIKAMLKNGGNINELDGVGKSALHWAIYEANGHYEMIEYLIELGASVDIRDNTGSNLLSLLLSSENIDYYLIELILKHDALLNVPCQYFNPSQYYFPVHICCEINNATALQLFLTYNANVHVETGAGETSLHLAVKKQRKECVKVLLEHGARVDARSKLNQTPLHYAVYNNDCELTELLLERNSSVDMNELKNVLISSVVKDLTFDNDSRCVFDILQKHGFTLDPCDAKNDEFLYAAVKRGYTGLVLHLLNLGANPNSKFSSKPLLSSAIEFRRLNIVNILLKSGCDVNLTDGSGETALNLSVIYGFCHITEVLLSKGHKTDEMIKLVCEASKNSDVFTLKVLFEYGGEANAVDNHGFSPLYHAVNAVPNICQSFKGNFYKALTVKFLLTHGALVDFCDPLLNLPCLYYAIELGQTFVVSVFIDFGASMNFTRTGTIPEYSTMVHVAARCFSSEILKILLRNGGMVDAKQYDGTTPLQVAVKNGSSVNVKILLEFGADITVKEYGDMSVLHLAVFKRHREVVEVLLNHGLDVDMRDGQGRTPLYLACVMGFEDIVKTLLAHGADINTTCNNGLVPFMQLEKLPCAFAMVAYNNWYAYENGLAIAGPDSLISQLQIHAFKMDFLGIPLHDAYAPLLELTYSLDLISSCQEELELMKTTKMIDSIFPYQVLNQRRDPRYMSDGNILKQLKSRDDLTAKFPFYSGILLYRIRKAKQRHELLNIGEKCLSSLLSASDNNIPTLPNELIRLIVSFLDNTGVQHLIDCEKRIVEKI